MQCFLVGYRGTCHLSLVFSSSTENTNDAWYTPRSLTRKHCITTRIYVIPQQGCCLVVVVEFACCVELAKTLSIYFFLAL